MILSMRIFPRSLSLILPIFLAAVVFGGAGRPSAVPGPLPLYEVDLSGPDAWARLVGVDVDLISVRPGYRALVLGWPGARQTLEDVGLCPLEAVADYGALNLISSLLLFWTGIGKLIWDTSRAVDLLLSGVVLPGMAVEDALTVLRDTVRD